MTPRRASRSARRRTRTAELERRTPRRGRDQTSSLASTSAPAPDRVGRGDEGEQDADHHARHQVADPVDEPEEPEAAPADRGVEQLGGMRALRGLDEACRGARRHEEGREHREVRGPEREADARAGERRHPGDQDGPPPGPIGEGAGRVRGHRVRRVVCRVQCYRERGGVDVRVTAGLEELGRSQDQQRRREVAQAVEADAGEQPAEWSRRAGERPPGRGVRPVPAHGPGHLAHERDDRDGGEQAGDHADGEQPPVPDRDDQGRGEQRTDDRADGVHGPLDPERATELLPIHGSGEEAVSCGCLAPSSDPGSGAGDRDDGPRRRDRERAVPDGGDRVRAGGERGTVDAGTVRDRAAGGLRDGERSVGDTLDGAERSRRRADRAQEAG